MEPTAHPIIIVKKKGGHEGHHGGAWKVAYADFVTAMMALFIVLWLLNTSQDTQKLIGGYFMDPLGKGKDTGSGMRGAGQTVNLNKDDMDKLKEKIQSAMKNLPQFQAMKNQVRLTVTGEGLRIELLENKDGIFFESGRAEPTESCREMLDMLSHQLATLPNKLLIEGHTDSHPYNRNNKEGNYTNWELSADRANAARRLMEIDGLKPGQVAQVRGFADQNLFVPDDPENASNRRVSVIVQYSSSAILIPANSPAIAPPKRGENQATTKSPATSPPKGGGNQGTPQNAGGSATSSHSK